MNQWIVLLMRSNDEKHRPVPFGTWDDSLAAREWADTELQMHDDEYYILRSIREVNKNG